MTTALVASEDVSVAKRLAETLSTPTLLLHAASDPEGAELWGAFKNVVALACGLVDGLKTTGTLGGDNLLKQSGRGALRWDHAGEAFGEVAEPG